MWDPKRLSEDRTPSSAKSAPRPPESLIAQTVCSQDATCPSCLGVVQIGDLATELQPINLEQHPQVWHRDCWLQMYPRFADAKLFTPHDV